MYIFYKLNSTADLIISTEMYILQLKKGIISITT